MSIISVDLSKYREWVHGLRRAARAMEFKPWDLKVTIPAEQATAEAAREEIRERYSLIQLEIDYADTVDNLEIIVAKYNKFSF